MLIEEVRVAGVHTEVAKSSFLADEKGAVVQEGNGARIARLFWPTTALQVQGLLMHEEDLPLSECLKDCVERTVPYWESDITPALMRGKTVLVAAHGNSIRGILKHIDGISDDDITGLEIPTGIPLVYHLDKDLKPIKSPRSTVPILSGYFLADQGELEAAQKKVADQTQVADG